MAKVIETWNMIKEIPNYEIVGGTILFQKIFELAPGAHKFYSFGNKYDDVNDAFFQDPGFIQHSKTLFAILDAAINLVKEGKTSTLGQTLISLGKRHYTYGVRSIHYPIVGEALIYTLQTALGKAFTRRAKHEWNDVYAMVFSGMIEGTYYAEFDNDDDTENNNENENDHSDLSASSPTITNKDSKRSLVLNQSVPSLISLTSTMSLASTTDNNNEDL